MNRETLLVALMLLLLLLLFLVGIASDMVAATTMPEAVHAEYRSVSGDARSLPGIDRRTRRWSAWR